MTSWMNLSLDDEQTSRLDALEKICACPILASGNASDPKKASESKADPKSLPLRDWYIECANEPPKEDVLLKRSVERVNDSSQYLGLLVTFSVQAKALCRYEDQCTSFLNEVAAQRALPFR